MKKPHQSLEEKMRIVMASINIHVTPVELVQAQHQFDNISSNSNLSLLASSFQVPLA